MATWCCTLWIRGEVLACKFANFGFSKKRYDKYNYIPNFMLDAFIRSKKRAGREKIHA